MPPASPPRRPADRASRPLAASAREKSSRSSDLGAGRAKYGCASSRPSTVASTVPPCQRAVAIERAAPVCRATQSSSGPLPGPVSNATSDRRHPPRPIHVTLATPPMFSTASGLAVRAPGPRGRPAPAARPRRPPPRRPSGNPQATGTPVRRASSARVADLPGPPAIRLVQDGLAMEADQVRRPPQCRDRPDVVLGQPRLGAFQPPDRPASSVGAASRMRAAGRRAARSS